jgi:hypothetical protein
MISFLGVQAFPTITHLGFGTRTDPRSLMINPEASFSVRTRSPNFADNEADNASSPFAGDRERALDRDVALA